MDSGRFRFERFLLDMGERRLKRDDDPVELNARYLDALALLVREQGRLVSKDRFLDEVWRGVPVTDEALTQCIKTLRRQLGDDAARPRFIETVPKHGYRFIAAVEGQEGDASAPTAAPAAPRGQDWRSFLITGGAGTAGAAVAGLIGGLIYGFGGASQPAGPGVGEASVLMVLVCITLVVASIGGIGVSFGIAAAGLARSPRWQWSVLGGGGGGLFVGAVVKLLGIDAFNLLLGRSPGDITGAAEGALLGSAVGFAAWLAGRRSGRLALRLGIVFAAAAGGIAGLLIPLLDGRLLGGSLDLVSRAFPDSRLRFDAIGALFGESGFGPVTQAVTGALEGMLFSACTVAAMILARRRFDSGNAIF